MATPNTLVTGGGVVTPVTIPTAQYGPCHWISTVMVRQDDSAQYIFNPVPPAPPAVVLADDTGVVILTDDSGNVILTP